MKELIGISLGMTIAQCSMEGLSSSTIAYFAGFIVLSLVNGVSATVTEMNWENCVSIPYAYAGAVMLAMLAAAAGVNMIMDLAAGNWSSLALLPVLWYCLDAAIRFSRMAGDVNKPQK